MGTLTIIKQEVEGCGQCPFNHYSGGQGCTHPSLASDSHKSSIPSVHWAPDKGAPAWCPLKKEEVLVTWEGV